MLNSMTGYASQLGEAELSGVRICWEWELRAVNGRGLDMRLRLPEGYGILEKPLRDKVVSKVTRGNLALSLRLRQDRAEGATAIDKTALADLLQALVHVQRQAATIGLDLRAPTSLEVLTWHGPHPHGQDFATFDPADLGKLLLADADRLLEAFCAARASEGAALQAILAEQIAQTAALVAQARAQVPRRAAVMRAQFQTILAQFADMTPPEPSRLEQELAVQAVKADLTEELDRLDAHCASARALLAQGGAVGRRLEFLTQEFNREANTLCAKAQHMELTRIGLALKSVIDQMREQVQNLE